MPYRLATPQRIMVRPAGLEPAAYRSEVCRSIQLRYGRNPCEETKVGVNDGIRTHGLQGHNLAL